jgi:hypothetical protein
MGVTVVGLFVVEWKLGEALGLGLGGGQHPPEEEHDPNR